MISNFIMLVFFLSFLSFSFEDQTSSSQIKAAKRERYLYCLCPVNNFDRCKANLACDSYQVPQSNYITMNSRDAFLEISKYNNSDIYIYISSPSTSSEVIFINLNGFEYSNNVLRLNAVDFDYAPNINIRDNRLILDEEFQCVIQGVSSVSIDQGVADIISVLTLKNSPLSVTGSINLRTLVTDTQSIKSYQGTLNIKENLTFNSATPARITGNLILQSDSSLNLEQSSSFPVVSLRDPVQNDDPCNLYICLSDEYEDNILKIGIQNEGNKPIIFKENSNKFPSITVFNYLTKDITGFGELHFDFYIPSQGMNLMFNNTYTGNCVERFPEGFYITISEDMNDKVESQTDASLLQLLIDSYCNKDSDFPIRSIDGNINMRLMSSSTVQAILTLIDKSQGFSISNLDSLTINAEDYLTQITFITDGIKLTLGGGSQVQNSKSIQDDDNSIILRNNISETYYIICSSTEVNFDVEADIELIHHLTIITQTENMNLIFSPNFNNKYASNITINHGNLPVTINTTAEYVPLVNFDDEILNVSYVSSTKSVEIATQSDANNKIQRAGPVVTYKIGPGDILFTQNVCLAREVTFDGNNFKFDYINEAISSYTFNQKVCILHSKNESLVFKAKSVNFASNGGFLDSLGTSQCKIDAILGDLNCHFTSIPSNVFLNCIKISRTLTIGSQSSPEDIDQIFFSSDSVRTDSSARIQQINDNNGFIPGFIIHINGQKRVTLSYETTKSNSRSLLNSKELVQNSTLYLHGNPANLFVDKSWYQVNIPNSFKIVLDGSNTNANIETELIEFPNLTFYYQNGDQLVPRTDFTFTSHSKPFVETAAFKVLIAFAVVIGVAIVVAAIWGTIYCVKKKKSGKMKLEDSVRNNDNVLI